VKDTQTSVLQLLHKSHQHFTRNSQVRTDKTYYNVISFYNQVQNNSFVSHYLVKTITLFEGVIFLQITNFILTRYK